MPRMIIFNQEHWEKHPEDYPEVGRFFGPLTRLTIRFTDIFVEEGDLLVERQNGKWFAVPKDVFSTVIRSNVVLDIERPWLNG